MQPVGRVSPTAAAVFHVVPVGTGFSRRIGYAVKKAIQIRAENTKARVFVRHLSSFLKALRKALTGGYILRWVERSYVLTLRLQSLLF